MSINTPTRLSKIAREFNVGIATIVEFLKNKGINIDPNPNTKITAEQYELLLKEYSNDLSVKQESDRLNLKQLKTKKETISLNEVQDKKTEDGEDQEEVYIKDTSAASVKEEKEKQEDIIEPEITEPKLNILGKIDLEETKTGKKKKEAEKKEEKPEKEKVSDEPKAKTEESKTETEQVTKEEKEEKAQEAEEAPSEIISHVESPEMEVKVLGKIDLESMNQRTRPPRKTKEQKEEERKARLAERKKEEDQGDKKKKQKFTPSKGEKVEYKKASGDKKDEEDDDKNGDGKKRRKRIKKSKERIRLEEKQGKSDEGAREGHSKKKKKRPYKPEVSEEDVQKQIKDTLARLTTKGKSKGAKYRREKRDAVSQKMQEEVQRQEDEKHTIKVTEFVSVNELASLMKVPPTEVIATCMSLGLIVSINQRLDAETMSVVADEFGYKVEFISVEVQEAIKTEEDDPDRLAERPPIVTVMGHVDHGKTKLLDHIRNTNVIGGEAGGITQHIGAYSVEVNGGKKITFLDTPGHEAFTAMRARGAQITDVAIIVVAADDGVKPQTVEAINHAQAAGVPMVFAINKIDKPTANPDKVKEELANMNILVEDWGGKFQSQEISAKNGLNIDELLEKVLLEAEMLELKADPIKHATGTVIESSLDRGRGYVATILVESGTLHIGDIVLAGTHTGRVKAMYNERGKEVKEVGPATPVLILGLNGAPQAGDKFNVMENEKEARDIANKREQLQREQEVRTQKHITLDEIGRRIAIGNFQELNAIVKGDVDGSVEALSDSLIKLSTEEIQVNIIHKGVGQISEGDILLAAASNAIVIGFQVRPSASARKLAEKEEIDVRLYSVIYDAIEEVKAAMEGMLTPEIKEDVVANLEVLETFKISKTGTIAGCMVKDGKIKRDSKVRLIRDGIVIYSGELGSLKRFKDDAKEVASGLECGLNIENFNDVKVGDVIEAYQEVEIKKTL